MSHIRFIIFAILIIPTSVNASITEGGRGMLFGHDHAFSFTATSGWLLDNQSGVNQGLHMVFYPKGGTWSNSPVIIYGRAIPSTSAAGVTKHVENTINDFRKNGSPNYSSETQAPITLSNGQKANIYFYSGDQWGNYEAVAYFQEKDTINYLVYNSRTKENFDKYIGDFYRIVTSYQNLYSPPSTLSREKLEALKIESSSILTKPGGKEYESKAVRAVGQTLAHAMRDCTSYLKSEELPDFSYYVRIDSDGSAKKAYISPTNALSACFKGLMSNASYPSHSFKTFVLNIDMKISP